MEPNEKFLQMWRRSPQTFIVSVLYFVVVDGGAILENGIELNVLRLWKMESRVETESLQTTNHKNEIETPESKYKMHFAVYRYTLV